jgi:hypothetical protein
MNSHTVSFSGGLEGAAVLDPVDPVRCGGQPGGAMGCRAGCTVTTSGMCQKYRLARSEAPNAAGGVL